MPMTHDQAVAIQRRHEAHLMSLPGVVGVSVVLRDSGLVIEVSVDPDADVPAELAAVTELDGLSLAVVKRRYELQ